MKHLLIIRDSEDTQQIVICGDCLNQMNRGQEIDSCDQELPCEFCNN